MPQGVSNILVLCTANSARSILAEAILRDLGGSRVRAFSAGSKPGGGPNPVGLSVLAEYGHDTSMLSSKSWEAFAGQDAPRMDIVITVCDSAAGETCPIWPGAPVSAHWGIPDPAGVGNTEDARRQAFHTTYGLLSARIRALLDLPLETMAPADLKTALNRIGAKDGAMDGTMDGATDLARP